MHGTLWLQVRTFTERLDYCINGNHIMPFSVAARVVPVTVDLSTEELLFEYSLDNWEPFLERVGAIVVLGSNS